MTIQKLDSGGQPEMGMGEETGGTEEVPPEEEDYSNYDPSQDEDFS
jgi:hypothetical protein